jgi:hypothetical protein
LQGRQLQHGAGCFFILSGQTGLRLQQESLAVSHRFPQMVGHGPTLALERLHQLGMVDITQTSPLPLSATLEMLFRPGTSLQTLQNVRETVFA